MKKVLYIDAPFGISGDMLVAALLDMGADYEHLQEILASLKLKGFAAKVSRVKKSGIEMCDFFVELDAEHENHDHDMAYLHGSATNQMAERQYGCDREHNHEHEHHHHEHEHVGAEARHGHEEHHHHHEHRGMAEIRSIIKESKMSPKAQAMALRIFEVLARAEAKAHGTDIEHVHFHEVGAVDSIVDVVSIAVCMESLAIDDVAVGTLTDGHGTIRCQHGLMAVPVPAVTHIVEDNHLRLRIEDIEGELVTPTGAAAVAALKTMDGFPTACKLACSGMGAGKREYQIPTFLRLLLLEAGEEGCGDEIVKIETNLDDLNGEAMAQVQELLFGAGALDVFFTPIYMKKNRPAYMLTVLCKPPYQDKMTKLIFAHTTSIGVRYERMKRTVMQRRELSGMVKSVEVSAKECRYDDIVRLYPEYESIHKLLETYGTDYATAYELIRNHVGDK